MCHLLDHKTYDFSQLITYHSDYLYELLLYMSNYHLFTTCSLFPHQHLFNCNLGWKNPPSGFISMSSMCLMFLLRLTSPVCQIIPSLDFSSWPTCPSLIGLVGHRCQFPNINPSFLQRPSVATTPSNHFTAVTPLGYVRDNCLFAICVAFSSQNLWGCLSSPTPSIVSLGRGTFQSAMAMVKFTIVSLGSNNCDTSKRTARINKLKTLQDFQNYIHDFGGFTWNKTAARYEMTL